MNLEILKKLIKIVLLIVIISYGLDKLVFFGLNKVSDKVMTGQAIGKLNHFLSVKDSANFLVFGNSRANRHIDVDLISSRGFNMGIDGIGIAYNSTLIKTLPKKQKQFVLVHIDTKNFFDVNYDGSDIRALKTKYKRDSIITKTIEKSGQLSAMQQFYSCMNYNGNSIGILKNYFRPNYNYKKYKGYDPLIVSTDQEEMRDTFLKKYSVNIECEDSHEVNAIALNYLKSIKSFIEKTPNKTYIFVTSPIYNDTCLKDNEIFGKIMNDLNLNYHDFSNLYKDQPDNSLWKDATHMSQKGAESFTKLLKEIYNLSNI